MCPMGGPAESSIKVTGNITCHFSFLFLLFGLRNVCSGAWWCPTSICYSCTWRMPRKVVKRPLNLNEILSYAKKWHETRLVLALPSPSVSLLITLFICEETPLPNTSHWFFIGFQPSLLICSLLIKQRLLNNTRTLYGQAQHISLKLDLSSHSTPPPNSPWDFRKNITSLEFYHQATHSDSHYAHPQSKPLLPFISFP